MFYLEKGKIIMRTRSEKQSHHTCPVNLSSNTIAVITPILSVLFLVWSTPVSEDWYELYWY